MSLSGNGFAMIIEKRCSCNGINGCACISSDNNAVHDSSEHNHQISCTLDAMQQQM
jgi:hypothetical protein